MKPRLLVAAVVVLAATFALFASGRGGDDAALAALRTEPLAAWEPARDTGWSQLSRSANEARGSRPAFLRSNFAVEDEGDDTFDAALEAARRSGWTVHDLERSALSPPVQRTATGRKAARGGRELRAVIVLTRVGGEQRAADELTIELSGTPADG